MKRRFTALQNTNPTIRINNVILVSYLPEELGECNEPRDAERGRAELGGLPPVLLGEPGGKLSATDINAAMGLWLLPP